MALGGGDLVELEGFLCFGGFFDLGNTSLQRSRGREVSGVLGPPSPILPPAHLLLKSFSMYLLMFVNHLATLGSGDGCSWTSLPKTPSDGTRRAARHPRASAHAQYRDTVCRGAGQIARSGDPVKEGEVECGGGGTWLYPH